MGLFHLLAAMTIMVAITLYIAIKRVYKPKHMPAPLPPKEPKRKKNRKKQGGGKPYKTKFKPIQVGSEEDVLEQDVEELDDDEMKNQTGATRQLALTPNGESMNGTTAVNTPKKTSSTQYGELDTMSPAAKVDTKSSLHSNCDLEKHMTTTDASKPLAATSINGSENQASVANASTQMTTSAPEEPASTVSKQPASTSPGESQYHTPETGTPEQVLSTPGKKKSRKKKARHQPLAPSSQSSATRASDDIETPTQPAHPTPAAEFIPLFSLVEPGNLDQTVRKPTLLSRNTAQLNSTKTPPQQTRLSHSLSRLIDQMTLNLRLDPGRTRTTTLISLLWKLHFASSPNRALPSSGSARDRHLEARDIACQFLNRYGALFWPPEPQPAPHLCDRELQWPRDSHLTIETAREYERLGVSVPKRGSALDLAMSELGVRMTGVVEVVFELPIEIRAKVDWRAVGFVLDDREVGEESLGEREGMLGLELRREVRGGDDVVLREIEELSPGF